MSLLKCVNRYLSQYQGLQSYFLSCEEAETVKVKNIVSRLENPLTKPLLHFVAFVLPSFARFNRLFQKSTTSQLYDEMNRLYAGNFLTLETVLQASDNLKQLCMEPDNLLAKDKLGIGTET